MAIIKTPHGTFAADVDGHTYEFEKWGAEEATGTLLDISSIIGRPIGGIAALKDKVSRKPNGKMEITGDVGGRIAELLAEQLGTQKPLIMTLLIKLASYKALCDGKSFRFDTHYSDRLGHMLRVVAAGLEVQFGSFFADALRAAEGFGLLSPEETPAPSKTPSTASA